MRAAALSQTRQNRAAGAHQAAAQRRVRHMVYNLCACGMRNNALRIFYNQHGLLAPAWT